MSPTRTIASLHDIIRELTQIESELDNYIDTTLWISDPHGAGDRFVSILKGRFGLVWRTCYEALPKTFSMEKIDYIGRIIRKERYFISDIYHMDRQDIISALGKIIDYKVQNINDFDQIRTSINKDLKKTLENIILHYPVPNIVYENELIADRIITALCKIVKQVILGHLIVLGDVFDRGDEPDKIIRILNKSDIRRYVTFIWGNHDILWMGAAAGNRSMIAQALRISTRYDNLEFLKRSEKAMNLYHSERKLFWAKNDKGEWFPDYDPAHFFHPWTGPYYEGSAMQYSMAAPHLIPTLIESHGEAENFVNFLDHFFMNEYYTPTNEPNIHIPWLFIYAGRPDKTAYWVRNLMNRYYSDKRDGLPGDDDSGTMSAWYVWAALGIYAMPGQDIYLMASPAFEKSVINLGNEKKLTITAKNFSEKNIYINDATINGQPLDRAWFRHHEIINGAEICLMMNDRPNEWGRENFPFLD